MLRLTALILLGLLSMGHAVADARKSGDFDYYVLSLSWSPSWCAIEGDARGADQCDPRHDHGFMLHGLWPQYEKGWPSFCQTSERNPSRGATRDMADIMGSDGLAWHQWDKHGRCSGLSADDYFSLSRQAYNSTSKPKIFRKLLKPLQFPATVVESAFLEVNDSFDTDSITVTCKRAHFQEVRLCLTRDLQPRTCGADVRRDCTSKVTFPPVR